MKRAIFITGTDTGAGKTVIAGCCARFFQDLGLRVVTQKWVSTGSDGFPADIKAHLRFLGKRKKDYEKFLAQMSPYSFRLPASPHLAAEREGIKISKAKIVRSLAGLTHAFDIVIIEGTGGILVPLTRDILIVDLVKELRLPVVIVAFNRVGAINRTLLTVEALKNRGIEISGIIFNNVEPLKRSIRDDNVRITHRLTGERILGIMPRVKDAESARRAFAPIGEKLREALWQVTGDRC